MKLIVLSVLVIAALASAADKRTFTGVITDSMCAEGDHSRMRMGSNDAECTVACVLGHGASYVLYDGKQTWILSDQQAGEKFAGKKVTVAGVLDEKTKTIKADSIAPAK